MKELIEHIRQLSLKDSKSLSQQALKLFEEGGELAKVVLPYDNAEGSRHKFVDKEMLALAVADVILVAASIAMRCKISDEKLIKALTQKTYYWEKLQSMPSQDAYPYEIHVTVKQAESYEKFLIDCKDIGVKPVVLDLHTKSNGVIKDVMTSSTLVGTNKTVIDEVDRITVELEDRGYRVVRQKIETVPWHPHSSTERSDDNYFEAHIPVTVPDGKEESLYYLCKRHPGSHLSRNALKKHNNGTVIFMITIRHNDCDYETFLARLGRLKGELAESGYEFGAKDIVEWAIYDNNVNHDSTWTS
ncbi:hypothetical protein Xoosp13_244 [Xanthomonas phage Xoo-sp13]|nr:hypothetical protein Xoosp13_244 [Xanthomonas phage Xoo-sp13]